MDWDIHEENGLILGMQGSGKTYLTQQFLDAIPNVPRLIISPRNPIRHFGRYGVPIRQITQIQDNRAMLWLGKNDIPTHMKICKHVMDECSNMVIITDDAHEFASKQKISEEWATLINSGRNQGVTSIFISPAPNLLHNILLQSSAWLCSFRFMLESQIEYAQKNFFGDAAYSLMPMAYRPRRYEYLPAMEKHDFLYRHVEHLSLIHISEPTRPY